VIIMDDRPMAAVKALVEREGKLLGLKITTGDQHMWTLPGGHIEHGETPQNALHRQVKQQVSLDVTPEDPFGIYHYFSSDGGQVVVTVFSCEAVDGAVDVDTEKSEIVDYQWLAPEDLLEKNLNQDLAEMVEESFQEEEEQEEDGEEEEEREEQDDELPKLVRDRIPEIIEEDGGEPVTERVEDEVMPGLLRDKILEEARELQESGDLEEVADIYEALDRYLDVLDVHEDMDYIRAEKAEHRGKFEENIVLEEM
jgi:predicted house-cleaning noncanonical NTP pyrophosphatase (MazG superfamily)/8-oxo-dGTP pyrophosphatase MutT (NUDIX family)